MALSGSRLGPVPATAKVRKLLLENHRLREERDVLKRALAICSERRV